MRACRFIVTNRFMYGMLHVSSMLSGNIVLRLRSILGYNTYISITHAHTHTWLPSHYTKKHSINLRISTVALLDNYQLFEKDYTPYDSIIYNYTNSTETQTSLSLARQTNLRASRLLMFLIIS